MPELSPIDAFMGSLLPFARSSLSLSRAALRSRNLVTREVLAGLATGSGLSGWLAMSSISDKLLALSLDVFGCRPRGREVTFLTVGLRVLLSV